MPYKCKKQRLKDFPFKKKVHEVWVGVLIMTHKSVALLPKSQTNGGCQRQLLLRPVQVGSLEDPKDFQGLAHFCEHMAPWTWRMAHRVDLWCFFLGGLGKVVGMLKPPRKLEF